MTTLKRYTMLPLVNKPKLILAKELLAQITHMHKVSGRLEWSGPLFYHIEAGSLRDPNNLIFKAEMCMPKNIGTSGYTEYEFGPEMMDWYEAYPECMHMTIGHIHTHHSMSTFFSGTDTDELHDNAPKHAYYLSLIVNFDCQWMAKLAFIGKDNRVIPNERPHIVFNDGEDVSAQLAMVPTPEEEKLVMVTMDLDIILETDPRWTIFAGLAEATKKVYVAPAYSGGYAQGQHPRGGYNYQSNPNNQRHLPAPTGEKKTSKSNKRGKKGGTTTKSKLLKSGKTNHLAELSDMSQRNILVSDFICYWLTGDHFNKMNIFSVLEKLEKSTGTYLALAERLEKDLDKAIDFVYGEFNDIMDEMVIEDARRRLEHYREDYVVISECVLPFLENVAKLRFDEEFIDSADLIDEEYEEDDEEIYMTSNVEDDLDVRHLYPGQKPIPFSEEDIDADDYINNLNRKYNDDGGIYRGYTD